MFFVVLITVSTGCSQHLISFGDIQDHNIAENSKYVDVKYEKQLTNYSCGLAALTSVIKYWGGNINQELLISKYPPKSDVGYSIGELKEISADYGALAFSMKSDLHFIEEQLLLGRPTIVPLKKYIKLPLIFDFLPFTKFTYNFLSRHLMPDLNHFVVVCGIYENNLWIMNSSKGIELVKIIDFENMWLENDNALLLVGF